MPMSNTPLPFRSDNEEVRKLFSWLMECVETEQATPYETR